MANEGHIIVKQGKRGRPPANEPRELPKGSILRFFTPIDKGSSRPAFCLPHHIESHKEETDKMERNLKNGYISSDRKMAYEMRHRQMRERLDDLLESKENAKDIIKEDPDFWKSRREELAKEISEGMPSRTDVQKKRVNPHTNLKREKGGLERKKQEFIIISRAMQEAGYEAESNISFLERD